MAFGLAAIVAAVDGVLNLRTVTLSRQPLTFLAMAMPWVNCVWKLTPHMEVQLPLGNSTRCLFGGLPDATGLPLSVGAFFTAKSIERSPSVGPKLNVRMGLPASCSGSSSACGLM